MNSDASEWPAPPSDADTAARSLALFQAQLDVRKARADQEIALIQSKWDADYADMAAFHKTLATVATESIDRARANADLVQKAAAAIATLYTGVLGVAFSVSDRPLPIRGVLPALFLGLAVVLATSYLAYMSPTQDSIRGPSEEPGIEAQMRERLNAVVAFVRSITQPRLRLLRSSVVALGVGLLFLPAPFLGIPGTSEPQAPATPTAWPSVQDLPAGRLGEIQFRAAVAEVAAARKAQAVPPAEDDAMFVLIAVILGGLCVWLIPKIGSD